MYSIFVFCNVDLFNSVVSFLEMVRRSLWNFCRIEHEHIKNFKLFRAVDEINLPFQ